MDELFPEGYCKSKKDFEAQMQVQERDSWQPIGSNLEDYQVGEEHFRVYRATFAETRLESYIRRVEPLLIMSIETASTVEYEDPNWSYYLVHNMSAGKELVAVMSVYSSFMDHQRHRRRISQAMTLHHY